jgi:4-hydroxybenzoate polyprenyltransferase
MTARRRRALASALGALVVAILCAALSSNVDGTQHTILLVLTFAWLAIAASCVVNAVRTARPDEASPALEGVASNDDAG